jgi:hypothetical protein
MWYKKGFGANLNIMSLFMFNLSAVNPPVETLITTYNEAIFKLVPHQSKINANIEPASLNIICGLVAKTLLYFYIIMCYAHCCCTKCHGTINIFWLLKETLNASLFSSKISY